MKFQIRELQLLLAASIAAAGCVDVTPPDGSAVARANQSLVRARGVQRPLEGIDALFDSISAEHPEFAGLVIAEQGGLELLITGDDTSRTIAGLERRQIVRAIQPGRSVRRVRKVKYGFGQLASWKRDLADPVLEVEGVVMVGIDETQNRVSVGVERPSLSQDVREIARAAGLPADAIDVFLAASPKPTNLSTRVRPLTGGTRVSSTGGECTLGLVVERGGQDVALVNSHCTVSFNALDGGAVSQVTNPIGLEIFDENGWVCGTWFDRRCRHAEVAAISTQYPDTSGGELWVERGRIARTTFRADAAQGYAGSTTIDSSNPFFRVDSWEDYPFMNQVLEKVGISTGWTFGSVFRTCYDVNATVDGKKVTFTCQDYAHLMADPGDSGAPVFSWNGSSPSVTFYGIIWGEDASVPTHAVFSNVRQMRGELGWFFPVGPY